MKKPFLFSFGIAFALVLLLSLTTPAQAHLNAMHLVSETNATYTLRTGPYATRTDTGYGGSAYQSFNKYLSGDAYAGMTWYCNSSFASNYNWHLYIAIPYNLGYLDGIYSYGALNTVSAENFSISVNQENFANEWVYLGWTRGTGGKPKCSVTTVNWNPAGTGRREFWVDAMKYYPSASSTPPVYRHSFSQWIP